MKDTNVPVEKWQNKFLNYGSANGLGDLSMMISTVSDIREAAKEEGYKEGYVFGSKCIENECGIAASYCGKHLEEKVQEERKSIAEEVSAMFSVYPDGGIHDFGPDEELVSKRSVLSIINKHQ